MFTQRRHRAQRSARRAVHCLVATAVALAALATETFAQEQGAEAETKRPKKSWAITLRGGAVHQFETDIDDGGEFDIDRFFIQPGVRFQVSPTLGAGLTVGFGHNDYDFSGDGFAGLNPWGTVRTWRFSVPLRWTPDDKWTVFGFPTLRFAGERGADFDDGIRGGFLVGVSYKFSDTLTLGPGVGVLSQIEDDVSVFPILVVDWQMTETLRLRTGRGTGATQGPGLTLEWRPTRAWSFGLGVRREKLRFRLDDSGIAPDGVGQDRSFPVSLSATYRFNRGLRVGLLGGLEFGGKLRIEDEDGDKIESTDYDTAPFLGFGLRAGF